MPTADHVVNGVYIGGARLLWYPDLLRGERIMHVLKLYEDVTNEEWPSDFVVCNNIVTDGLPLPHENIQRGVAFVKNLVESDQKVLVACGAGISRSSTFVLAYMLESGYDLHEAWRTLKLAHVQSSPHPAMWQSLINYYKLSYTLDEIVHEWLQM